MTLQIFETEMRKRDNRLAADIAEIPGEHTGDVELGANPKEAKALEIEWFRQAINFTRLGFHTEFRLAETEYLAFLPKFTSQPEKYKGRFDIPVLVEPRIPPIRLCQLAGIKIIDVNLPIYDWMQDPNGYQTPRKPYVVWMQDGSTYLGKSVEEARRSFASDERGAKVSDGIALVITHPEILKYHFIDLPGSSNSQNFSPTLQLIKESMEIFRTPSDISNCNYGSATCGR